MRLLLRIFSLSSWLALAACGIVLNSCAMASPDVVAPPPLAAIQWRLYGHHVFGSQEIR